MSQTQHSRTPSVILMIRWDTHTALPGHSPRHARRKHNLRHRDTLGPHTTQEPGPGPEPATHGHATTRITASSHANVRVHTPMCKHTLTQHVTPSHIAPPPLTDTNTFLLHRWRGRGPLGPNLLTPCTLYAQQLRAGGLAVPPTPSALREPETQINRQRSGELAGGMDLPAGPIGSLCSWRTPPASATLLSTLPQPPVAPTPS